MTGRTPRRLAALFLTVGLAGLLAVAGCGADDTGDATSATAPAPALDSREKNPDAAGGAAPAQVAGGEAAPAKPGEPAPARALPDDRSIIYTGTISVTVDNVDSKADAVLTAAIAAGGFVAGDNRTETGDRREARLVLRVPAERFQTVLKDIGAQGKEVRREISTQDVTEQVVDLNARIATTQASVDRVRALLARAGSISEIVALESEVAKREADLESLKAKHRKLSDLTALSTITVTLLGKQAPTPDDEPDSGFLAGLKGGWSAFVASMEVLLTVLGALLPWFLALGVPVLVLVWALRRGAGRRTAVRSAEPALPREDSAPA